MKTTVTPTAHQQQVSAGVASGRNQLRSGFAGSDLPVHAEPQ